MRISALVRKLLFDGCELSDGFTQKPGRAYMLIAMKRADVVEYEKRMIRAKDGEPDTLEMPIDLSNEERPLVFLYTR